MIFVINRFGLRYCRDGKLRNFAMFGTYRECIKIYRTIGWAIKQAAEIDGCVVQLPKSHEMDASGEITKRIPCEDKPGYVDVSHPPMEDFIVYGSRKNEIGEKTA
jgi:hypothetical protein